MSKANLIASVIVFAVCLGLLAPAAAQDQAVTAQAVVEKRQVFVGEPFVLQVRIEGSEEPEKPVFGPMAGFKVVELGGSQNSSQSVTIVNGRMSRVVERGYIFNYQLVAERQGEFTIPSITVTAEGQTVRTQPIAIRAVPPRERSDFKLRVSLSESRVYVGQSLVMTVTMYIRRNVQNVSFNIPVLDDSRLSFSDPRIQVDPDLHVQVPVQGEQVIAERGQGTLDGERYVTVSFRKIVVPRGGGTIEFPQSTVTGQGLRGYERRQSPFGEYFDEPFFSNFGRHAVFENFVVPSNRPTLEVLELPAAGRPSNFSGLIGDFRIEAEASPTEVNVGDPITMKIRVSGPRYLEHIDLPPLSEQPELANDFKIPTEQAAGVISGGAKEFSQTVRARHAGVDAIPPIELSYFNPRSGSYEVARTEPIPLTVHGTRVVTALDAEGLEAPGPAGSELESAEGGIAYNYEGESVLEQQAHGPAAWLQSPAWWIGLGLPPLVFLGLLGLTAFERWRDSDPAARAARQAYRRAVRSIAGLETADTDEFYASLLNEVRRYLGAKLELAAGALTFADVRPPLIQRGVEEKTLSSLKYIIDRCEAGRYAGASLGSESPAELKQAAASVLEKLEQRLS